MRLWRDRLVCLLRGHRVHGPHWSRVGRAAGFVMCTRCGAMQSAGLPASTTAPDSYWGVPR